MYRNPDTTGPAQLFLHLPQPGGTGPYAPGAPLWEQWREIYAAMDEDALVDAAEALAADEARLAGMCIPDRMAHAIVEMRMMLVEERLQGL